MAVGGIFSPAGLAEVVEDDINADLARYLTCGLPAHAIADDEDAELGVVTEIVFVVSADAAHVALADTSMLKLIPSP